MMYHREKSANLESNPDRGENISKKRCPPEKSFPENSQNHFGSLNKERFDFVKLYFHPRKDERQTK